MEIGKIELKEKMAYYGTSCEMAMYSDAELLSIVTGVAPEKFDKVNLLDILRNPRIVDGIGKKKGMILESLRCIAQRLMNTRAPIVEIIHGPEDAAHYARNNMFLRSTQKEYFCIICLNTKNHALGLDIISIGSMTASVVHPREVFDAALKRCSAAMILIHNHPSGDPTPSGEDIAVTQRLVKAGKVMDIHVLDHIILGDGRFISIKEEDEGKGNIWR